MVGTSSLLICCLPFWATLGNPYLILGVEGTRRLIQRSHYSVPPSKGLRVLTIDTQTMKLWGVDRD